MILFVRLPDDTIAMADQKHKLSLVAFALFLAGILLPIATGSPDGGVLIAITATILALVLGFATRAYLFGRIAWIGALIVTIICSLNAAIYFYDFATSDSQARIEKQLSQ